MPKADISQLRQIIDHEVTGDHQQMLYRDAFATGCFLHKAGHKKAGLKLCKTVLRSLGYERRKTYFNDLIDSIDGNEDVYAEGVWAHAEVNELFEDAGNPA